MVPYYQTVINTLKNTIVFIVFPTLKYRYKLKYFNCPQVGNEFGTSLVKKNYTYEVMYQFYISGWYGYIMKYKAAKEI